MATAHTRVYKSRVNKGLHFTRAIFVVFHSTELRFNFRSLLCIIYVVPPFFFELLNLSLFFIRPNVVLQIIDNDTTQRVLHHISDNPIRCKQLRGCRDILFCDFNILFQGGENVVLFFAVIVLVQPADNLYLVLPILLWDERHHLLYNATVPQQVVREEELCEILDFLEHPWQNSAQSVALGNDQVLEQFIVLVAILQSVDLLHIQAIQLQIYGLGKNLRLKSVTVIRKYPHTAGQIPIDLHKTQSGKAVKPCIGDLFHHRLVAFMVNSHNQGLTLFLFCGSQHLTMHTVRPRVTAVVLSNTINRCPLRYARNELSACPHCVFFYRILIHSRLPSLSYDIGA